MNKRVGTNIQPGERLILCSLNFSVIINLKEFNISLFEERTIGYLRTINYWILNCPQGVPKSFDTEIDGLVLGDGSKFIALGSRNHVSSRNILE